MTPNLNAIEIQCTHKLFGEQFAMITCNFRLIFRVLINLNVNLMIIQELAQRPKIEHTMTTYVFIRVICIHSHSHTLVVCVVSLAEEIEFEDDART